MNYWPYPIYQGPIHLTEMPCDIKQGYFSWRNQRNRCTSKKHPQFNRYGARGIKVHYSARQFISWWRYNLSLRQWKDPTVGRIDHDGDYCFQNIGMQERAENTREVHDRLGQCGGVDERKVIITKNGKTIEFESTRAAGRWLGTHNGNVVRYCQGKVKNPKLRFEAKYVDHVR